MASPAPGPPAFRVRDLAGCDGCGPGGRILIGLNGTVYDVTKNGSHFYKKGGPYGMFAGRDATRGLSTFSLGAPRSGPGGGDLDLSTLQERHYRNCLHWQKVFSEKYEVVGVLVDGAHWPPELVASYLKSQTPDSSQQANPSFGFLPRTDTTTPQNGGAENHNANDNNGQSVAAEKLSGLSVDGDDAGSGGKKTFVGASRMVVAQRRPKVEDMGTVVLRELGQGGGGGGEALEGQRAAESPEKGGDRLCGGKSTLCVLV